MDEVKKALAAGVSFAAAIKDKLGSSIEEFCATNGLNRPLFSDCINGKRVPDDRQLLALRDRFGGSDQEWLDLWFKFAARRVAAGR